MPNTRNWMLLLCGPILLATAGGCPLRAIDELDAPAGPRAAATLKQITAGDIAPPPSLDEVLELAGTLGLSDEQQAQALAIFEAFDGDFDALRQAAVQEVRATLKSAQRALLEEVASELLDQAGILDDQPAVVEPLLELLAARLGLSADQQFQIDAIRLVLQQAVAQLREDARREFLNLLTAAQASLFDPLGGV